MRVAKSSLFSRTRSYHLRRILALSRPDFIRHSGPAFAAARLAFSASTALLSGHFPISLPVAGSTVETSCQNWGFFFGKHTRGIIQTREESGRGRYWPVTWKRFPDRASHHFPSMRLLCISSSGLFNVGTVLNIVKLLYSDNKAIRRMYLPLARYMHSGGTDFSPRYLTLVQNDA